MREGPCQFARTRMTGWRVPDVPSAKLSRCHDCQYKDTAFEVNGMSLMQSERAIHLACSWYSLAADSSSASLSPPADLILQQGGQEHSGGACISVLPTAMQWWRLLTSAQATEETLVALRKPTHPPAKQAVQHGTLLSKVGSQSMAAWTC